MGRFIECNKLQAGWTSTANARRKAKTRRLSEATNVFKRGERDPVTGELKRVQIDSLDLRTCSLFANLKTKLRRCPEGEKMDTLGELHNIASIVGTGMESIERQYESWRVRSVYHRRFQVETTLICSDASSSRRRRWMRFLHGIWYRHFGDGRPPAKVMLVANASTQTVTWIMGRLKRQMMWQSREKYFTSDSFEDVVTTWHPSVRHRLFDDDHVTWIPKTTSKKTDKGRDFILYTRAKRSVTHFSDIHPDRWCAPSKRDWIQ